MRTRILAAATALSLLILPVQATASPETESILIEACLYEKTADLSSYRITAPELSALFTRLEEEGRLPWYTLGSYAYQYNEATQQVLEFTPQSLDPSLYDRALYEKRLAETMAACILPGMTPEQIALSVHDYLILNCAYDESLKDTTGYDLLVSGSTVCTGYTSVFRDILNRAGVPCVSVSSESMEHTWNLVQIDGSWYHVDVTWDDPTPNRYGYVDHDYFLVTDTEIAQGDRPHSGWVTDITCTDSRYSDAWWRTVKTGVIFESSNLCYYQRTEDFINHICRRQDGTEHVLYTEGNSWIDIGYGPYTYEHQSLALRDGRLWFNTMQKLCSVDREGNDFRTEYRYSDPSTYIYSFSLSDTAANMTTGGHEDIAGTAKVDLPPVTAHSHSYTETVTPPTCLEPGSTKGQCDCGLTWELPPVPPLGHDHQETKLQAPTLLRSGYRLTVCVHCGDARREELPRLNLISWLMQLFFGNSVTSSNA